MEKHCSQRGLPEREDVIVSKVICQKQVNLCYIQKTSFTQIRRHSVK